MHPLSDLKAHIYQVLSTMRSVPKPLASDFLDTQTEDGPPGHPRNICFHAEGMVKARADFHKLHLVIAVNIKLFSSQMRFHVLEVDSFCFECLDGSAYT